MYFSHPTTIALACRLIGIDRRFLAVISSIYSSVCMDRRRVDIYKVAYLVEWLRRYQEHGESATIGLARLLSSKPEEQSDCADCARYATGIHEAALKELRIGATSNSLL